MIDFFGVLREQVEQNLRERQAGRERQDAGARVSGSRKELAALRKLSLNPTELMKAEASPEAAAALVRKNQVFPRPDFEAWRAAGTMSAGAAGFLYAVWKVFPDQPKGRSPFERMAYVRLARDLSLWISIYSSSKVLTLNADAVCSALLSSVFGYSTWQVNELGKKVNSYTYNGPDDLNAEDLLTLQRLLVGVRRFMPADALIRFLTSCNCEPDTSAENKELLRLLYDFPDPTGLLAMGEPAASELYRTASDAQDEYEQLQVWRQVVGHLLRSEQASKWLTNKDFAHSEERNSAAFSDKVQVSPYLPRLLALYFGSTFASLLFFGEKYLLRTRGASYSSQRKQENSRHVLMATLGGLPSVKDGEWDKVAKLLGLEKGADAAPKEKKTEPAERMPLSHIRRKGGVLVTDLEVHELFLLNTFGFRAVEYGNYVKDKEGTEHLRHFVSALTDLCDGLNLDPRKVNEAGGLAIAFGSRGHGGRAAATYHPSQRIINLTKSNGDGTVAHEWLHYLDHLLYIHLGQHLNAREPFASQFVASALRSSSRGMALTVGADKKVYVEGDVKRASGEAQRKQAIEIEETNRAVEAARKEIEWSGFRTPGQVSKAKMLLYRVWECIRNGYYRDEAGNLVTASPEAIIRNQPVMCSKRRYYTLPIPSVPVVATVPAVQGGLSSGISPLLADCRTGKITPEELLEKLQNGKWGYGAYFTLGPEQGPLDGTGASVLGRIATALDLPSLEVTFYKPVVSQFYQAADAHQNAAYWAAPWELWARSFERFMHDELALRGQANNYLVDGTKFSRSPTMYPQGEEALLINGAWRAFFAFLSEEAGLGPFQAPWAHGERVDEYLAFDEKSGQPGVSDGVITPATPPAPVPAPDRSRALRLAKAKVKVAAAAKAKARAAGQ